MNLSEYTSHDAVGLANLIRSGEVSAAEVSRIAVDAIARVNPGLNAVLEVFEDRLSGPSDAYRDAPLFGVPIMNKDLSFAEAGRRQEMGSNLTKGFVHTTDSTSVERMRAAGLNILGRTTTPEFGNSGLTESAIAGVTRNPWDTERTPGGSSGGSAAIVAAGAVPVATASDGGGSTRTPASHCGLVGLKASRGLIPVGPGRGEGGSGLTGPFAVTRSMRDCAALLDILAGSAPGDPYRVYKPSGSYADAMGRPLRNLKIAFCEENWGPTVTSEESRIALRKAVGLLQQDGHSIEEAAPVFDWDEFFDATITVMCSNLASGIDGLAKSLGRVLRPDDLQSSTWACYRHGKEQSATALLSALGVFNSIGRTFGEFLETYDLLLTPTTVFPAPLLKDCYSCNPAEDITAAAYQRNVYSNDHFVAMANTTGQPSITLPLHETADGIPLGVQVIAGMGCDDLLVAVGSFFEQAQPWKDRKPAHHASML